MQFPLAQKPSLLLTNFLRFLFLAAGAVDLIQGDWTQAAIALVSLGLTLIPALFARNLHVTLPPSYQILLLVFIFLAQFLGEMRDFYYRFWWWDILLHSSSGVLLGFVGFLLVYVLNEADGIRMTLSPLFIAIFGFCFALACGVIWEIFEFTMDSVLGTNMQKSGLRDTMGDLIVDTLGALAASVTGLLQMKRWEENSFIGRQIRAFLELNPRFRNKV